MTAEENLQLLFFFEEVENRNISRVQIKAGYKQDG